MRNFGGNAEAHKALAEAKANGGDAYIDPGSGQVYVKTFTGVSDTWVGDDGNTYYYKYYDYRAFGGSQKQGPYAGIEASLDGFKQYLAIVVGESSNNIDEAAGIGSVILNRLTHRKTDLKGNFVSKIGGTGQYDAIGGPAYNEMMALTTKDLLYIIKNPLSIEGKYSDRIMGAIAPLLNGQDYSGGAYFWNATYQGYRDTEHMGSNFRSYCRGIFESTDIIGGTSFFRYYDKTKKWP